jgi:hypothetical protein
VYLRFHGYRDLYSGDYPLEILKNWAMKLAPYVARGLHVFVYFNNDFGGYAIKNAVELKFALLPKQVFGKWNYAKMPEPFITEISSINDETKTVEISFPESAVTNNYLDKILVTYGDKTIDFTSGRTQTIDGLRPNTKYTFTAKWKDGVVTNTQFDKSYIWSNDFEFTTSKYVKVDDKNSSQEQNTSATITGKWTLHLKCIDQSDDASVFDFNIVSNSTDSRVYSIQGTGTGTDYGGESMNHVVNGSFNADTKIAEIAIATTFPGTSDYTRTDRFSAKLDVNDTGYVSTTQSWHPSDGQGCDAETRLNR